MFTRFAVAIALSLALACPTLAGRAFQAAPGSRVRIKTIAGTMVEGRLQAIGSDSLVLRGDGGQISVPRSAVSALESWRGRGSRWRSGVEIGWLAGFAATSVVYGARMRHCVGSACAKIARWEDYAAAGGLAGALVGGLVGSVFRHDRWQRVPLGPLHPEIAIAGGASAVGVSIRF